MFQREAAERIRARSGERAYGALSLYTALYWNIADHFRVGAGSFRPRPKVDAEVLVFTPREPAPIAAEDEQVILRTIRAAFTAPRKTLRNSLAAGLDLPPSQAAAMLEQVRISPEARAATLTLEDILRLADVLKKADTDTVAGGADTPVAEDASGRPTDLALDHA
jgi:16S rRNA (adenine1518-N6/adenine1519-N6)-dimethyltransferase